MRAKPVLSNLSLPKGRARRIGPDLEFLAEAQRMPSVS